MLRLNGSYILILLSLLFCSCEKELSLEGTSASTAVFTFAGGTGACPNAGVSGTYQVGTALGSSNTIALDLDVAAVGTYTITTGTLNGISFTGTGVFTSTGPQTVILMGTGIPTTAGASSFTPGTNGCSFIVNISSGGGSGGTAVYTFSGAPGNCLNFAPGGTYTAGTPLGTGNFATISVNVTTPGTYTLTSNALNGISFSASGSFSAAGPQTINLAGTGTPLAGGTFNFTPGTNGCTFPITVSGAGGTTAVFTYTGAPNACTTATPAGTFDAGTALTASNTITLGVNVTTAGTYSISTPVVNGFSFAGTGSFASTGLQSVTLTGAGTPLAAGVSNFIPTNGCSFPITVTAGTVADFLKCSIDGVARTFNVGLVGLNPDPTSFIIAGDETSAATTPSLEIDLVDATIIGPKVYNAISPTNTTTYSAVGFLDGTSTTPWGVAVAGQSGKFSVTVTSYTATKITGTFSGTLYINLGLGTSSKAVTGGQFSVSY